MLPLIISFLIVFCSGHPLATASSPTSSSASTGPSYVSVRALDKYGHSEQLQNALKAANLQGTLVVAARDPIHNNTLVLSLLETSRSVGIISKAPSMLQLINSNPAFLGGKRQNKVRTAMVCTGLKADASWLLRTVRAYSHRVWTRYNTFLDAPTVAHAVAKYFRFFWGYDEEEEWSPVQLSQDLEDEKAWGRPLGVVAMIASSSLPFFFVIEPSGIIQRYQAFAMGKYSNEIIEKLGDAVGNDTKDLQEQLVNLIQSVVPSTKKDTRILVETLSDSGIDRTVVNPYR